jgi:DNA processing protein
VNYDIILDNMMIYFFFICIVYNLAMYSINKLELHEFPKSLFEIPQPPTQLYYAGTLPDSSSKLLCIVGSRKYTSYGKEVCQKLIAGLSGYNIVIVSGLAMGIDAIAHKTALEAGLKTVAIPGSGLHPSVLYPSINRALAESIVNKGGCLLSEFEPTFKATTWSFPQRNRIMAGLSHAILVIEAEQKSGTLITSRLATEYNKDVLTVPGNIFSKTSEGPHMLLKLGATPITSSEDILNALGLSIGEQRERNYTECTPDELEIIELLKNSPFSRDELTYELDKPIYHINATLTLLELRNCISEFEGKVHLS